MALVVDSIRFGVAEKRRGYYSCETLEGDGVATVRVCRPYCAGML